MSDAPCASPDSTSKSGQQQQHFHNAAPESKESPNSAAANNATAAAPESDSSESILVKQESDEEAGAKPSDAPLDTQVAAASKARSNADATDPLISELAFAAAPSHI